MRLPLIQGLIRRRLLVNFRVDPDVIARQLPAPFRPKLHRGFAIAGICLIRLEQVRPVGVPAWLGLSSENAAHRVAVEWTDAAGQPREGVYIPRRDTGSELVFRAGGRLFPGQHHRADFQVNDAAGRITLAMRSRDDGLSVRLCARESDDWPADSCFPSLDESSAFFEQGRLGYSVTRDRNRLEGLELRTLQWDVRPLAVDEVASSYFVDETRFPPGSLQFDHALVMRDIPHEWRDFGNLRVEAAAGDRRPEGCGAGSRACV